MIDKDRIFAGDRQQIEELLLATMPAALTRELESPSSAIKSSAINSSTINSSTIKYPSEQQLCSFLTQFQQQATTSLLGPLIIQKLHLLHDDFTVAPKHLAIIAFIESLLNDIEHHCNVDPILLVQIQKLKVVVVKIALLEPSFLTAAQHICKNIIDEILQHGVGWYPGLGKSGRRFIEKVELCIDKICTEFQSDSQIIRDAGRELIDFLAREQQIAKQLTVRYVATETGVVQAKYARSVVIDLLNKKMVKYPLPKLVSNFLQNDWKESLILILINHGVGSKEWARATRLMEHLIWSIQPTEDADDLQKIYNIIPRIGAGLEKSLISLKYDKARAEQLLTQIQEVYLRVLKREKIAYQPVAPLVDPELEAVAVTAVSKELLKNIEPLQLGQWFLYYTNDNEIIRCRLALKLPEINQLRFVDLGGLRALEKSFDDFAYCLSTGAAILIDAPSHPWRKIFTQKLKQLFAQYESAPPSENIEVVVVDNDLPLIAVVDESVEEVAVISEEEKELFRQSAEKALREAERLAVLAEQATRPAATLASMQLESFEAHADETLLQDLIPEQLTTVGSNAENSTPTEQVNIAPLSENARVDLLTAQVKSMELGTWLSYKSESGEEIICKLAAKMRCTERLIFVNRYGIKLCELKFAELVELLLRQQAEIKKEGQSFESTLSQVVGSMRRLR